MARRQAEDMNSVVAIDIFSIAVMLTVQLCMFESLAPFNKKDFGCADKVFHHDIPRGRGARIFLYLELATFRNLSFHHLKNVRPSRSFLDG